MIYRIREQFFLDNTSAITQEPIFFDEHRKEYINDLDGFCIDLNNLNLKINLEGLAHLLESQESIACSVYYEEEKNKNFNLDYKVDGKKFGNIKIKIYRRIIIEKEFDEYDR